MRILRMKLENFQGIRELEIQPDGESCSIYGDNGTGKSTIYNAFTWLMYGKPSTQEKNYTPKTTGSHNLHHSVEMDVRMADGSMITLKKDYHEVYKTVKGNPQPILSGHTTDYSVDGVPVNETQFKRMLSDTYRDEELAKMLTMYDYFLDSMKVADRRKILLQVCGDADFLEVIESQGELLKELPELLRKPGGTDTRYTVDEYRAIVTKKKSLTDKELANIPQRIDEAEKAKPDVTGLDPAKIDEEIERIRASRRELESQKAAGESAAAAVIRQQIVDLELQRTKGEVEHRKAESLKNKDTFERINRLLHMVSAIEMDMMQNVQEQKKRESEIQRMNRRRESLLREWQEENGREWGGSEICPTCGRPLPSEQIEEAKAKFHIAKAQRLEEINQRGLRECSGAMIRSEEEEIERLRGVWKDLDQEKEEAEKSLEAAEKATLAETEYKSTAEYADLTGQIESLKGKMMDLKAATSESDRVLNARIRELDILLEAEQQKKAQLEMVERQDVRIRELEQKETELAATYEELQKGLYLCDQFTKAKTRLLDEKINSRFKTLRFRLFIEQQNGGIADDCEALIPCASGLVPFKSANNAARINAGLELIDVLAEYYGVQMPVFVDNAESITQIQRTEAQVIRLVVSEADKALRFEKKIGYEKRFEAAG